MLNYKKNINLIIFFISYFVYAQETLTLSKIDSLFIRNNYLLLSKKYNVDAQKALVQQARLFENPNVYIEQNIYNSNNNRFLDISKQGEYIFQVQQLIKTAGKRQKEIKMAELNYEYALLDFEYFVQSAVYQMHCIFYQLVFSHDLKKVFVNEIEDLEPLVREFEIQFEKGNVSLKEVFRLRAILFNLQSALNDLNEQIADLKKDLSLLIGVKLNENIRFHYDTLYLKNDNVNNILSLIDTAYKYRSDLKLLKKSLDINRSNYALQKALRIPDVQLGYTFDKAGNFMLNYQAFSFGFSLPVFNRNQGNVRAADFFVKQSEAEFKQKLLEIENELLASFNKLSAFQKLYINTHLDFLKKFDNVKDGMRENFMKRNISVLEYADFFESYLSSVQQYYLLLTKLFVQRETLNFQIGRRIFK